MQHAYRIAYSVFRGPLISPLQVPEAGRVPQSDLALAVAELATTLAFPLLSASTCSVASNATLAIGACSVRGGLHLAPSQIGSQLQKKRPPSTRCRRSTTLPPTSFRNAAVAFFF